MEDIFENNFTSFEKFFQAVKKSELGVTRKAAKEFYDAQSASQIFKTSNKKQWITISCPTGISCIQADLMDVSKYAQKNKGIKFLLNAVDVRSRHAWSFPLKNKIPTSVVEGVQKIVEFYRKARPEENLTFTTDQGTEFKGAVERYLTSENIKHYQSDNKTNTAIVERFHRTMWNYFKKKVELMANLSFVQFADDFVKQYNESKHRTLGITPEEAFYDDDFALEKGAIPDDKLKVGDYVRTSLIPNNQFDKKSFQAKFSREVLQISGQTNYRYSLKTLDGEDVEGTFLERQLLKVAKPVATTKKLKPQVQLITPTEENVAKEIEAVEKTNRTVRRNKKDFAGNEVEKIGETVVYKPRLQPKSTKKTRRITKKRFEVEG
jgi:hypothetical protein